MTNLNDNVIAVIDAAAIEGASQSSSHVIIRTKGAAGSNRFAFTFRKPEDFGRDECHGPILSGPYLAGFGVGTVLHNGPVTANPIELYVRTGDVVAIRNLVERGHLRTFYFVATVCPRGYVSFECVKGTESKMTTTNTLDITRTEISKDEYSVMLKEEFDAKHGS